MSNVFQTLFGKVPVALVGSMSTTHDPKGSVLAGQISSVNLRIHIMESNQSAEQLSKRLYFEVTASTAA